jgi:predicted glycosyltransferase
VVARLLGVRSIYMNDNEHAMGNIPAFICASRIMVPEFLADEKLRKQWASAHKVVHYPGVKEGIYLWELDEQLSRKRRTSAPQQADDRALREGIPSGEAIPKGRPTVYVRPEPWTAQYYKGSRNFLDDLILGIKDKTRVVVLPRGKAQGVHYREPRFAGVEVVDTALDLAHVAPDCDLFVGAGGTMTREMAVLGIPTISVYQDQLLDVDRYLLEVGAFVHVPDLTAAALLSILESAARKPANRLLLEKGRQAYALIKESILGNRMAEESMGADRC